MKDISNYKYFCIIFYTRNFFEYSDRGEPILVKPPTCFNFERGGWVIKLIVLKFGYLTKYILIPEEVITYTIMKTFIANTLDKYSRLNNTEKKVVQCTAIATGIVAGACTINAIGATTLVGKAGAYLAGGLVAAVTSEATIIGGTHAVTEAKKTEFFNKL